MNKGLSLKNVFIRLLLLLPLIYVAIGWSIGLNYARKGLILGPYGDIPVVAKRGILGSSVSDISGGIAMVSILPPQSGNLGDDSMHFTIKGYFEVPESWVFDFPPGHGKNPGYGLSRSFF
jgi:hypothetical protein